MVIMTVQTCFLCKNLIRSDSIINNTEIADIMNASYGILSSQLA